MEPNLNTTPPPEAEIFEQWAKIELTGRNVIAGLVRSKNPLAPLLRVDIPDAAGNTLFTTFVNPQSIYRLTPVDKQIAIGLAVKLDVQPVTRYSLTQFANTPELPGIGDENSDSGMVHDDPED